VDASRALVDALAALEGEALDAQAARKLAALSPTEAVRAIADLVERPWGERERKALAALCRALTWPGREFPEERREELRAAALGAGKGVVAALLTKATAERFLDEEARRADREVGALTLGHRKQLARACPKDTIDRLALDGDPQVIRNLLMNPRVTEALVVRIAARRPAPARVLEEVARSRWSLRPPVRLAIALNPYSPPTVVNPLLATLSATDLRSISEDPVLHPAVREAAQSILSARDPR